MLYTEKDLPLILKESELVQLSEETQVRYEENGGAKDVFINDEWAARTSLFDGMDWQLDCAGCCYNLTAKEDGLHVEKR
ncbi:hypothetical protein [Oleidesulfovibrio sp.]|uniref:hypothetical protein n=1 Tax=Oleidesulfovibrio sp. TaxID=2909707 RepID=UPI003A8A5C2B